jgi:hypothetical protein
MKAGFAFISHTTRDDQFVQELCRVLEGQELSVWGDSRNLRGDDKLVPEIDQVIAQEDTTEAEQLLANT